MCSWVVEKCLLIEGLTMERLGSEHFHLRSSTSSISRSFGGQG